MKRISTDTWVLGGLLVLFAVLTFVIGGRIPENPETTPRRSTYSAKPGGLKAAYLLLQKQGLPVARNVKEPRSWPADARVMITATPLQNGFVRHIWSEREIKDTLKWLDAGGSLIVLHSEQEDLLKKLGFDVQGHLKRDADLAPLQPATLLHEVKTVAFPDTERFLRWPASGVALFGDLKPAVVLARRGKGRIYAVATPAVMDNATLAEADNARFVVQLVRDSFPGNGKIYFNEFHQGATSEESLWTIIGKPGQFAFFQLIALAVLIAYSAARRFGLPRPLPAPPRVSSEYVGSLADLYRRARATDAALEGVYLSFWRDLCRAVGMSLESDIKDVAKQAAALSDNDKNEMERRLRQLLEECERKYNAGPTAITETDLLRLARDIETMRKELRLGGDDR